MYKTLRAIIILVLVVVHIDCAAQYVNFQGFVHDSIGRPLELANVLAVNANTNEIESFTIADDKGRFKLPLRKNSNYIIKTSFVGYTMMELEVVTKEIDILRTIVLIDGILMEEVEIVHEIPVRISGDTIIYNSDSFTNGTERKLEDILKKLPGIEVDDEGAVTAQGKPINKLMVEGKDFFEGNTKLGTKNIPADAIDKVEVVKNYNEIAQLKGLDDDSANTTLNIKLKEGKKNFWFGDTSVGAGPKERYSINPKSFYYSRQRSFNLIGNLNNTGDVAFSPEDYFRMSGDLKRMMRFGGTGFESLDAGIENLLISNNLVKELNTRFGAASATFNPSKSWTVNAFAIASSTNLKQESITATSILDAATGDTMTRQSTSDAQQQKNEMLSLRLGTSYEPGKNFRIDNDLMFSGSKFYSNTTSTTEVWPDTEQSQNISENSHQSPVSFSQDLAIYYKLKEKHTLSFTERYQYEEKDPFYNAVLQQMPFNFEGFASQEIANLNQQRFTKNNRVESRLDYYWGINRTNQFKFTLGTLYAYQNFNSGIFQLLDNGSRNYLNGTDYINNVDYRFFDLFGAISYKVSFKKFIATAGVNLHKYSLENRQAQQLYNDNFYMLLPDVTMNYDFGQLGSLDYSYKISNRFMDIEQLATAGVLRNYNLLFVGNSHLRASLSQDHQLYYSKYNSFNMSNLYASISYSKTTDAVNLIASYNGMNSVQSPFNSLFANQSLNSDVSYGRSLFGHYKFKVGVSAGWDKYYNMQQHGIELRGETPVEVSRQRLSGSVTANFIGLPTITLGYSLTANNYPSETYYTHQPTARLEYYFGNGFSFVSDYKHYDYSNSKKTILNRYGFLNAAIAYHHKDSLWDFRLSATNLLDTKIINNDSFSTFSTSSTGNFIQPRYLLFSTTYKI